MYGTKKCDVHSVNFLRRIAVWNNALFGSTYDHDLPLTTTRTISTEMDIVSRENRGFDKTTDLNKRLGNQFACVILEAHVSYFSTQA